VSWRRDVPWSGTTIAVKALEAHGLNNPAFAEVLSDARVQFLVAPPTDWLSWYKNRPFPYTGEDRGLVWRHATDDEIAVVNAKLAMLADPLPDLETKE
jgi:hypothetical protein